MNIIFHRFGNVCEPDVLSIFKEWGITVYEDNLEITQKSIPAEVRIRQIVDILAAHPISFIFSINYFPYLSMLCERLQLLYVCFSVDCPVLELFSETIRNHCNRIFLFDHAQYKRFHPENPDCVFYLPLAANVSRLDQVLSSITVADRQTYSNEISFVGSLYNHDLKLTQIELSDYTRGLLDGILTSLKQIHDFSISENLCLPDLLTELKAADTHFPSLPDAFENIDRYIAANYYISPLLSSEDRILTLRSLADLPLSLYTRSNTAPLTDTAIRFRGGLSTLTEMPKVFYLSKINLNITIRSIQTGLSQRIWDVLGCHGFLLTDYQAELPEYFEIGKDLDCYETPDELKEKAIYYLAHDDVRQEIASHGYHTVKEKHTWQMRLAEMLQVINQDFF